ncbi:hypothetical protein Tco_0829817 [Tanacetum coccineum]
MDTAYRTSSIRRIGLIGYGVLSYSGTVYWGPWDHLKMEIEMEIPSVKAFANSDIIFFFTSAQDGNKSLDDERLSLADDLKKAHDQNQNKSK